MDDKAYALAGIAFFAFIGGLFMILLREAIPGFIAWWKWTVQDPYLHTAISLVAVGLTGMLLAWLLHD